MSFTLRHRERKPANEANNESNPNPSNEANQPPAPSTDEPIENKAATTTDGGDAMDVEKPAKPTASVVIMPQQTTHSSSPTTAPPSTGNSLGGSTTASGSADDVRLARLRALEARMGASPTAAATSTASPTPIVTSTPASPTDYAGPRTAPVSIGGIPRIGTQASWLSFFMIFLTFGRTFAAAEDKILSPQRAGMSPTKSAMSTTPTSSGVSFGKSPSLSSSRTWFFFKILSEPSTDFSYLFGIT